MKIIITTILATILTVSVIHAVTLGQNFTQNQIDGRDFSSENLGLSILNKSIDSQKISVDIGYLNLQQVDGGYTIINEAVTFDYSMKDYTDCRITKTKTQCVAIIKQTLLDKIIEFRNDIRTNLNNYKSITASDLTISDLSITDAELNN